MSKYRSICNCVPLQFISFFNLIIHLFCLYLFSFSVQELLLSSNDLEDLLVSAKDNDSIRAKLTVSINTVIFHLYCICSKLPGSHQNENSIIYSSFCHSKPIWPSVKHKRGCIAQCLEWSFIYHKERRGLSHMSNMKKKCLS